MAAAQASLLASFDEAQASSATSPSPSPPKRVLSLLLKIQPWGNAKTARLRAMLGLVGPFNPPFGASAHAAEGQSQAGCIAKEAWLAHEELNGDGCVVLEVTDGNVLPQHKARPVSTAAVRTTCFSIPSGGNESDEVDDGNSDVDNASEPGTESATMLPPRAGPVLPASAAAAAVCTAALPPQPPPSAASSLNMGPAMAALAKVTARRRRRKEAAEALAATAGRPPAEEAAAGETGSVQSAAAVPGSHFSRSSSLRQATLLREPLHPNWQLGNRRAAFTGSNARGWIPFHLLAQAQVHLLPAANSPRSSGGDTAADGSGGGGDTDPSSPLLPPPQPQQQLLLLQPGAGSSCSSPAAPFFQSGVGGGTCSRASSTHSDRVLRSGASGLGSASPVARVDSLTGFFPFAWPQHLVQSGFMTFERDRDRDRGEEAAPGAQRLGPIQGLLRGSRMQGHVTAVANPAYVAAAAASTAALAAAVGAAVSPAGTAAASAVAAASSGLPSGAPAALLREHSHRRLQQSAIEPEAIAAAAAVASHTAAAVAVAAGPGAGAALRPSLGQQRDSMPAPAVPTAGSVAANNAQRHAPQTMVVAAGLQGHAVTLRPGSPYQLPYQSQGHHHPGQPLLSAPTASAVAPAATTVVAGATSASAAASLPWQPCLSQDAVNPQHHQMRGSNSNFSLSQPLPQQQQQQLQMQQQAVQQQMLQRAQSSGGSLKQRRPSLTGFGNARAQLQHRSTDDWTVLLPEGAVGGGGGRVRDLPLSASVPHLAGTWSAVAAAAADAPVAAADGGATAVRAHCHQPSVALPPQPPHFILAEATAALAAAPAGAGACGGPPGVSPMRPSSSSVATIRPISNPAGLGASGGGNGLGLNGTGTAWLSGGVSLLQALASGSDAGVNNSHPRHHHNHHNRHNRHGGHSRPPRAPLPAGGGDGGGGGGSFWGMAPGRGSGVQRPHGKGSSRVL